MFATLLVLWPSSWFFFLPFVHSSLILALRRRPDRPYHALQTAHPRQFPALAQPDAHVLEQGRVPDIGCVAIPVDVGEPFKLCRVGVPGPNVTRLQLLELLLSTKFVRLYIVSTTDDRSETGGQRTIICVWRVSRSGSGGRGRLMLVRVVA